MKINSIHLKDFISHRESSFDLNDINIVVGANGRGKSALRQSIAWALTGDIDRDPVNWDAKSAKVVLSLSNGVQIMQSKTNSGSPSLAVESPSKQLTGSTSEIRAELLRQLNVTTKQIDAILNTRRFADMKEADRKDVVFRALNVEVTPENLSAWLEKNGPEFDWPSIVSKLDVDLNDVDGNKKIFTERRRSAKRESDMLSAELDRLTGGEQDSVTDKEIANKASYIKHLNGLQDELADIHRLQGSAGDIPELEKRIAALKADLEKPNNTEKIAKLQANYDKSAKTLKALSDELNEIYTKVTAAKTKLGYAQADIEKLETLGDVCDRCKRKITPAQKKKILAEMTEKESGFQKDYSAVTEAHEKKEAEHDEVAKTANSLNWEIEELKKTNFEGDRKAIQGEIDEASRKLENLRELAAGNTGKIAELKQRIEKGQAIITRIEIAERNIKRRVEIEERSLEVVDEIAQFDAFVKAYEPKGLKADLLKSAIDRVNALLNKYGSHLDFGDIKFITERGNKPVFELEVNGNPENAYSRAQRQAIGVAVQMVLSSLCGLGILCIEDADMFKRPLKEKVNDMIFSNAGDFETVLIFSATDIDSEFPAINQENISVIELNPEAVEVA